jgi:hypothetical protein
MISASSASAWKPSRPLASHAAEASKVLRPALDGAGSQLLEPVGHDQTGNGQPDDGVDVRAKPG